MHQPFDCTIDCLEVLTVHCNDLRLFWANHVLYSNYLFHASYIAAVGNFLMSLVMTRCWANIRTYHLLDNELMRYILRKCLSTLPRGIIVIYHIVL